LQLTGKIRHQVCFYNTAQYITGGHNASEFCFVTIFNFSEQVW